MGEVEHANAPDLLLPGALRGAQFHAGGRALRHLSTLADQRYYRAGAGVGRRAFPAQARDRAHLTRSGHTSLSPTHRRERRSCARRAARAGRCAAGAWRRAARKKRAIPLDLIAGVLSINSLPAVQLGEARGHIWSRLRSRLEGVGGDVPTSSREDDFACEPFHALVEAHL